MSMNSRYIVIALMCIFVIPFILYIVIGMFLTQRIRQDNKQSLFENGSVPVGMSGNYEGNADAQGSWLGKEFYEDGTGINNFDSGDSVQQQIPFKYYVGKSVSDDGKDVLKIDYNIPENPFYLRLILDELVELENGSYLGKVNFMLIPFFPITFTYFTLEK